jgi:hypothetical protein
VLAKKQKSEKKKKRDKIIKKKEFFFRPCTREQLQESNKKNAPVRGYGAFFFLYQQQRAKFYKFKVVMRREH